MIESSLSGEAAIEHLFCRSHAGVAASGVRFAALPPTTMYATVADSAASAPHPCEVCRR